MARKRLSGPREAFLTGESSGAEAPRGAGGPPIAQVAAQTAAENAVRALSDELSAAKAEGRMVLRINRSDIQPDHLARDRVAQDDEDMRALIQSIRTHGQRTPIEVTELPNPAPNGPRYGLISGWRRLAALEALSQEEGGAAFQTVQALLRQPKDASDAYVSMVEENEIRVGLSYYERARVAAVAAKRGGYESEKQALLTLFANVSRAKRSRIRSFIGIYHALDGVLQYPTALPERLGLSVAEYLKTAADQGDALRKSLRGMHFEDAAAEMAALAGLLTGAADKGSAARNICQMG